MAHDINLNVCQRVSIAVVTVLRSSNGTLPIAASSMSLMA